MARESKVEKGAQPEGPSGGAEAGLGVGESRPTQAHSRLERARGRFLLAALAFCDGSISAGQLRAARELLREQEQTLSLEEGQQHTRPFVEEPPTQPHVPDSETLPGSPIPGTPSEELVVLEDLEEDLKSMLGSLDSKMQRLEHDFQQGRINASQYRAIRRHYVQQRDVALRMRRSYPESDRWKLVLEEGKTSFLLQLNEASIQSVSFYHIPTGELILYQGESEDDEGETQSLLNAMKANVGGAQSSRMLATRAKSGAVVLLMPGRFSAAIVRFSQEPPGWQARALREVHRNFEAANKPALERGERKALVFPDFSRFFKP